MRAQEFISEVQRGVLDILRDELPDWPDYVLKDMVIAKIKSPQDLEMKLDHVRELATMVERWHRTMAAFRLHPEGFRVNAWIGTP